MTIGRKIASGFGVTLVALATVGVLSLIGIARLIEAQGWVSHTQEVLAHLDGLLAAVKDAEAGERGYVITADRTHLKPYDAALRKYKDLLQKLKELTADNPRQRPRLDELGAALDDRFEALRTVVAEMDKGGFKAAAAVVKERGGKEFADKAAGIIRVIRDDENDLLTKRQADADASTRLTTWVIGSATVLTVLLVAVGGFFLVRSITTPLREAVNQLASGSSELLATTAQQASGAQEQAAAVAQTVTTVDEVAQTAEQSAQRARSVGDAVQRTTEVGKAGRKAAADAIKATAAVKDQVETTAENILTLAEQAQAIGEIIATVNDIAEQTNLLALNAAIEASRAGEHGRGFAVVAGEVKALADQSKKATGQVRQILGEIQKATNTAVLSTEEVTKGVAEALRVGEQAGETIKALAEALQEAARAAAQIVASVGQQSAGMGQIHQAMKNIDQVAKQNAVATRQASAVAETLNALGARLTKIIAG